jgi:hypothetical protein
MSLLTFQQRDRLAMEEDAITAERFYELQEIIGRLQLLVCELLVKNQQLRVQRADE